MTKYKHIIYQKNSKNIDNILNKNCVDLIVTSPPYFDLKDYGSDEQIGFGQSYDEYIKSMNNIWSKCDFVLKNGCRICINIGEVYQSAKKHGKYLILPVPSEIINFFTHSLNYEYFGSIVWTKVSSFNPSGGASVIGSYPYPRNGMVKYSHEYILIFRKKGNQPKVDKENKKKSKMTKEQWNKYFYGLWNIPGKKQSKHGAEFPKEIPTRLIRMYSFVGDTVLDPFCGTGTTTLSAIEEQRNSFGFDVSDVAIDLAEKKLKYFNVKFVR